MKLLLPIVVALALAPSVSLAQGPPGGGPSTDAIGTWLSITPSNGWWYTNSVYITNGGSTGTGKIKNVSDQPIRAGWRLIILKGNGNGQWVEIDSKLEHQVLNPGQSVTKTVAINKALAVGTYRVWLVLGFQPNPSVPITDPWVNCPLTIGQTAMHSFDIVHP